MGTFFHRIGRNSCVMVEVVNGMVEQSIGTSVCTYAVQW